MRETPLEVLESALENAESFKTRNIGADPSTCLKRRRSLNKDIGEEMPKVQQLLDRVKRLEFRDYRRGEVIVNIEKNNQNHRQDLADLHNVLKAHEEQVQR